METKQEEQAVERHLINNVGCKILATLTEQEFQEFLKLGYKETGNTTQTIRWGV